MNPSDIQTAVAAASAALEQHDLDGAFAALAEVAQHARQDAEAAAACLALYRLAPEREGLVEEIGTILESFPDDPRLVTRGCDALIRCAERLPPDQLPPPNGAAARAAQAAERCLLACGDDLDRTLRGYLLINLANALRLAREHEAALAAFDQALALEPERAGWWFNLGLLHKARGAFEEALSANQRAQQLGLDPEHQRAVLWNTAICATALGRGELAADAFRALGRPAELNPQGMPYVPGLPPVQVRVASIGSGLGTGSVLPDRAVSFELLWVTPLSPCHGVVSSASYRDASVDYGDVVLWDAVPIAVAEVEGRPVPRFPILAVLSKGREERFRFVALQQASGQVAALGEGLPDEARMFIHREQVEMLCSRCASGESMHKHKHVAPEPHRLVYGKIVLPPDHDLADFRQRLEALLRSHSGVQLVMPGLLEALGDSAAAGKAHQMWRGLERTAEKHLA